LGRLNPIGWQDYVGLAESRETVEAGERGWKNLMAGENQRKSPEDIALQKSSTIRSAQEQRRQAAWALKPRTAETLGSELMQARLGVGRASGQMEQVKQLGAEKAGREAVAKATELQLSAQQRLNKTLQEAGSFAKQALAAHQSMRESFLGLRPSGQSQLLRAKRAAQEGRATRRQLALLQPYRGIKEINELVVGGYGKLDDTRMQEFVGKEELARTERAGELYRKALNAKVDIEPKIDVTLTFDPEKFANAVYKELEPKLRAKEAAMKLIAEDVARRAATELGFRSKATK